jgi:O-antigen chain-terminating methyltransferase
MATEKMRLIAMRALGRAQPLLPSTEHDAERVGARLRAASSHVDVHTLPPAGSLRSVKRVVLRLSRPILARQAAFNREALAAVSELNHLVHLLRGEIDGVRNEVDQLRRNSAAERALLALRLDEAETLVADTAAALRSEVTAGIEALRAETVSHVDAVRGDVTTATASSLGDLEERLEGAMADVVTGRRDVDVQLRLLRDDLTRLVLDLRRTGRPPTSETVSDIVAERDTMFEATYERFEEQFRGATTEIEKRLEVYLPDVEPLAEGDRPVLDLGSGRGEWLHLLKRNGIPAFGVDTSERFAALAGEQGLDVRVTDALSALTDCSAGSLGGVTAFQLVEHLPVPDVRRLADLAYAALAPGGILILETPNPTNLRVGAGAFYRDPTHLRPVHPDLLGFLVSEAGFVGSEARFLNPMAEYGDSVYLDDLTRGQTTKHHLDDLRWALYGPQDYAIVARKPAEADR